LVPAFSFAPISAALFAPPASGWPENGSVNGATRVSLRSRGPQGYASSVAFAAIGFGAAPPPGLMWNS
jgi:hypothetical protein